MNYKTFNYDYNKDKLLSLFVKTKTHLCYEIADLSEVDKMLLPMMNVFNRELSIREYGLAELVTETGMHVNPRNNGLIMFPVKGLMGFTFDDGTTVKITQPTITNGLVLHTYYPIESPAIFFAIKIPTNISYAECCLLP